GTAAEVERLLGEPQDRARRPLQVAGVVVVVGAGVEGREQEGVRRLLVREGHGDRGPRLGDSRVLDLGEPQGGVQVDRVLRGRRGQDGGGGRGGGGRAGGAGRRG